MKKNLLIISDYIEGEPVVASVRYAELMKEIKGNFNLYVVNNINFGAMDSIYSIKNYKFTTFETNYSSSLEDHSNKKRKLSSFLRKPFILKIWRNLKLSKTLFYKKNKLFLKSLENDISVNNINCVFVTVPDVYGLYILKYIKKKYPTIPVVVEIRDILNHSIGIGNPRRVYAKAETILLENADKLIALSEGIKKYYSNLINNKTVDLKLIRNGYDYKKFIDCEFNPEFVTKKQIIFSHIGSIYKGRNITDLIKALDKYSEYANKEIVLNIVGVLDNEAVTDLSNINRNRVKINILGTKPHEEAIEILKKSDIAVILTHKKGSDYAIPGKTFEYIGSCKPILAVTEDKELIKLIEPKYGVAAKHNVGSIVQALSEIMKKSYDFSDRKKYSREQQAMDITNVINTAINDFEKDVKI
ncbi:glycosyltransferase [Bacillus sp. B4EP4a]|uniref:glycosyltransferase n=1 Tax=Bacillus sp. B4EP4a TaxID=2590665 RepID=UPI001151EAAB|nr:glycosyltransferase [Bacillus sp. B4EP4a]